MAWGTVPLDSYPDQEIDIVVDVDDETAVDLILHFSYNSEGDFWHLDITRADSGEMLLSNAPMLTGEYPAADLLGQFQHLGIGSAVIVRMTDGIDLDYPNLDTLGTDFLLVWGGGDIE